MKRRRVDGLTPAQPEDGTGKLPAETGTVAPSTLRHAFPWVVATLIAVHACMALTRMAASLWVLNEGYGEWTVGVLLSLFAVAPIVLSLWAGGLADSHGFHRPVALGVGMAFAGAVVALASQTLLAIGFSCLMTGGAVSIAAVAIQREAGIMANSPDELRRVFSWVALGPAMSNAIAPVIGGVLIDGFGFRWAFAFAVLLPVLSWMLARRVPRHAPKPRNAGTPSRPAWHLLRHVSLRNLLLVNVVLSACWDAHTFVVPVVGHAKGLSASSIGLVLAAFAVAATLVRLAIVRFARQLDELKALRAAMGLAATTLFIYAWLPGTPGMMLGSALLGLALGSVQPMIMSTLHQVTPRDRHGQALGLRMLVINGATIAMPVGFGLLASATAIAAPMWLMAGLLVAAQWPAKSLGRDRD
ncbi:MAG: MFS transporter [Betaproteobacteria bacterium]|nr:MFS transporter [Betaproteobacteria bacterium]